MLPRLLPRPHLLRSIPKAADDRVGPGPPRSTAGESNVKSRKAKSGADTSNTKGPAGEPLIKPGGKINPAAIFRAARTGSLSAGSPTVREGLAAPVPPTTAPEADPDSVSDGDDDLAVMSPPTASDSPAAQPTGQPVTFVLQRDLVKRLDKYLTDRITFMSRTKLQQLIEAGGVKVNGRVAKSSAVLREGDTVVVDVPAPPSEDFEPQDIPLDVVFEDEHLIVLNKQADIIVHPARTHSHGTLINALAFHFRHRSPTGGSLSGVGKEFARPGVVHRLDRHTSGLIVFAKSDQAHWQIANQFMSRTVDKRYVAVVEGVVEPAVDVIDLPLGPHLSRERGYREKQVIRHDHLGKPAVTVYRVLGVFGDGAEAAREKANVVPTAKPVLGWGGGETAKGRGKRAGGWKREKVEALPDGRAAGGRAACYSLVEVELKTGRTHQIRVHFSHLGWPLAGDDLYGGKPVTLADGTAFARQALHAAALSFRHPITHKPLSFLAPFPADLAELVRDLRGRGAWTPPTPPGATLGLDGVDGLLG